MKSTPRLLLIPAGAILAGLLAYSRAQAPVQPAEALTGFDDQSNGFSDPDRRQADLKFFGAFIQRAVLPRMPPDPGHGCGQPDNRTPRRSRRFAWLFSEP